MIKLTFCLSALLSFASLIKTTNAQAETFLRGPDKSDPKQVVLTYPAHKVASMIKNKEISCVELMQLVLDRISIINPDLNAVVAFNEAAMDEAEAADEMIASGAEVGPLHGVPITIKDLIDTKGIVTTLGTVGYKDRVPETDAIVVRVLKNAGAIIVGKTNTAELGASWRRTRNPVYGTTKNPYRFLTTTAGSSGGSAAIVSSCGSYFDIASDLGGSIRMPSAFCGLVGLKPTAGLVSEVGFHNTGIDPDEINKRMNSLGPIARHVDDIDIIWEAMVADPSAITNVDYVYTDYRSVDLSTLKIGYHYENAIGNMPIESVIEAVNNGIRSLQGLVSVINKEQPETTFTGRELYFDVFSINGGDNLVAQLNSVGTPLSMASDYVQSAIGFFNGRRLTPIEARLLENKITRFKEEYTEYFSDYDILLSPVFGDSYPNEWQLNVVQFDANLYCLDHNLTGFPVVTIPTGVDSFGLPVGVQIVARPYEEHVALAIAKVIETKLGGWQPSGIRIVNKPDTFEIWRLGGRAVRRSSTLGGEWQSTVINPYKIDDSVEVQFFMME
jgi:amidase